MSKHLNRFITLLVAAALICGAFFAYNTIVDKVERAMYPQSYSSLVREFALEYDVPEYIVYAVIKTESDFSEDALSPKGAVGLMQITPDTFEWLQTKTGEELDISTLSAPAVNIRYGVFFLGMLYVEFGNWKTVYAAYNAGRSRVHGWLADPELSDGETLQSIPFPETKQYVSRVANAADAYRSIYYTA